MQAVLITIGVVVLIVSAGFFVTNVDPQPDQDPEPVVTQEKANDPDTVPQEVEITKDSSAMREMETVVSDVEATAETVVGMYQDYDAVKIAASDAEHILLFFHAAWCPSCRVLDADIVAHAADIPEGVEIYKVDYDTAADLKLKYRVTTQHSVIEIAADGSAQSTISHPGTLREILQTI